AAVRAAEPGKPRPDVDFAREVYPVLQRGCLECHGPDKQRGGLRLDRRETALKGGESGPAVVPGRPEQSELLRRPALPKGSDGAMRARAGALSRARVALGRPWIEQGAKWPDSLTSARPWAYVRPARSALPAVKDAAWPRNALDFFILARLEKERLR